MEVPKIHFEGELSIFYGSPVVRVKPIIRRKIMQKIHACLWFDTQAEEAANFYVSLFKNSKIGTVTRYGEAAAKASGRPLGSVMTVTFTLDGQEFMALNGGPIFTFSPATSWVVNCDSQGEIDHYWEKLSAGGTTQQCGWLQDKYGVSWQIVPAQLGEWMKGKDPKKAERVMAALMKMTKVDLKALQEA